MDSKVIVGQRVKAARVKQAMTQRDLGVLCHMSADWICSIERGHRRAELGTIMKICHALKLSVEDIMGNLSHNHKPKNKVKPYGKNQRHVRE